VAENLWALREQKKLSVAALANRAGLPIGVIVEYEAGQRSIDPRHLSRLARALYVEESDVRLRSDPRPEMRREESRPIVREPAVAPSAAAAGPRPPRPAKERAPRPKPAPKPPAPARPSQIAHIEGLLQRLGRAPAELETEVGRPLAQLDRPDASQLIKALQAQVAEANQVNRHRAYLPEAVDQFEAAYLTSVQNAAQTLIFKLFDGSVAEGQVIGFGPYSITVRQADDSELTVMKLAIISYCTAPATPAKEPRA
jgi:transcriptional regulator with XRE-family HTH domain